MIKFKIRGKEHRLISPSTVIVIPLIAGVATFYFIFGPELMNQFAEQGDNRLTTAGWQTAENEMNQALPQYGPKYAYYKLQEGQNLAWAAQHFSVNPAELQKLNPGIAVWGTTILVPPVESPYVPFQSGLATTTGAQITYQNNVIYVQNSYTKPKLYMTIPGLMKMLSQYNGISEIKPNTYLINKSIYIEGNIRVDVTSADLTNLLLYSGPNYNITTLTFRDSEALFDGVNVSSYDPSTGGPHTTVNGGRSFLRAYDDGRMDLINTNVSYLGMTLKQISDPAAKSQLPILSQGGIYGVSWRISTGTFGSNIATGWVEGSSFEHNDVGAFTFGASGMMWRNNLFANNRVYGLDPHDDSDNATIVYNRFIDNGKHGFIVSKRCDYNTIENNVSIDNAYHGFMLHDNSDYNIIKNNVSIGNYDNFVLYDSNFNMISNNTGYNPRGSQVRISQNSIQNYVTDNTFYGGDKGVYLYGGDNGVSVTGNVFDKVSYQLKTKGATRVLFANNLSNNVGYDVKKNDRVVFGVNSVDKYPHINLQPLNLVSQDKLHKIPLSNIQLSNITSIIKLQQ